MTEVIRLDQVSLWRRTQEEFSYDLKKTVLSFVEGKYRKPARKLVLDRIDLAVKSGEKVGVIGANGSGKSTLLKVICGILKPTSGQVRVRGQIAPLIELGAGFDPDISVMDNIILYGVLLGFTREEMKERGKSILEFAELEDYAPVPVKALSSGMVARLGFAIATDVQPDILILDEVLSVGDESFKNKCKQRMEKFWEDNATILVVSHDLKLVQQSCHRVIWLDKGKVRYSGSAEETVQFYLDTVAPVFTEVAPSANRLTSIVEEIAPDAESVIDVVEEIAPDAESVTDTEVVEEAVFQTESVTNTEVFEALPVLTPLPRLLTALPCSGIDWLANMISPIMGRSVLQHNLLESSELISAMNSEASERLLCEHFDYDLHGEILNPTQYPELRLVVVFRNPLDFLVSNFHTRAYLGTLPDNHISAIENLKLFLRGYWIDKAIPNSVRNSRLFSLSLRDYFRRCVVDWYKLDYCLAVRYEDLVANPQQQLTRVLDYLNIPYSPDLVAEAIARNPFSIFSGGSSPHNRGQDSYYWLNVPGEWRKFLDLEDTDIVYRQIGDYMKLLGYYIYSGENPKPTVLDSVAPITIGQTISGMIDKIQLRESSTVQCYFITGTGRCGTMLMSKLLSLGSNTSCTHERSIQYAKMKPAYLTGCREPLYEEIESVIEPLVTSHNQKGMSYGECSALMYLTFDELYRRYGNNARFVLLIRKPEEFVRSALARGFFDPDHPYALEHLRALPTTEIGQNWETTSPFEKCLWYWNVVNSMVYDFFCTLPSHLWKIQRIEELDLAACWELYEFLQIDGFDEKAVTDLLSKRINATPGLGDEQYVNPWSRPISLGDRSTWNLEQNAAYQRWAEPILNHFYPSL